MKGISYGVAYLLTLAVRYAIDKISMGDPDSPSRFFLDSRGTRWNVEVPDLPLDDGKNARILLIEEPNYYSPQKQWSDRRVHEFIAHDLLEWSAIDANVLLSHRVREED